MPENQATQENTITSRQLWGAMAAYAALLIVLALKHEMWRDEVRALSVATKWSWTTMFAELQHEGHPSLWYILLRAGFALTHSTLVLPVIAIVVALIAAYLILKHAPFPLWLRLLAVFGVFLGYELSISPRNYGIGVMLMVVACLAYGSRARRPIVLGIVLALLANTSVHAAIATLVLIFFWLTDLFDDETREDLLSPGGIVALGIAIAGVVVSYITARPTPDMAWALSLSSLDYGKALRSVLSDPGKSLLGYRDANIAGTEEFPWRLTGIDGRVAARIIVDLSLAWLAWSLRRSWRALAALVLAVLGFAFVFRVAYTAGLRHEGLVLFLILSVCWLAVIRERHDKTTSKRVAFGLLPLFALQSLALPIVVQRTIRYPESSSKAFAGFIRSNPAYRDAILMAEPDYMMEALPYYVGNPVFMPRQREFSPRVYFDKGARRRLNLSLGELTATADSVACTKKKRVLLAIQYPEFQYRPNGEAHPNYRGTLFTWSENDWQKLRQRQPAGRPIAIFPRATSDEIYAVYEIDPVRGGCG
jgi:hypothetical protein